jgi:membrane-associated phospholipid phosphatase
VTTTTTTSPSAASGASLVPERPVEVRVQEAAIPVVGSPSITEVLEGWGGRAWWKAAIPKHPWAWLALFVMACGWDRAVWLAVGAKTAPGIEALEAIPIRQAISMLFSWHVQDAVAAVQYFGYHAIKVFGRAWVPAAIAAWLIIRPLFQSDTARVRVAIRRGVLLFLSAAVAGLVAELLKLMLRRERPEMADGFMSFRFENFWSASGLGLPSSHAAVAVASAAALVVVWPKWRWVWITLGACCVVSRVLSGAHFVSDVVLGTLVGLCAARAVVALDLKNNKGVPVGAPAA